MTNTQPTNQEIMDVLIDVSNRVKRVEAMSIDSNESIKEIGKAINEHSVHMDKRFDAIESQLGYHQERFDELERKMNVLESHFYSLEKDIHSIHSESYSFEEALEEIKHRISLITHQSLEDTQINGSDIIKLHKRVKKLEEDFGEFKKTKQHIQPAH